jgi:hypothetical protein
MIMSPGCLYYARRTAKIRQDKEREKDLENRERITEGTRNRRK